MGILDIFGNKKLIQEIEELKNKHKQLEGKLKQKNEELEALTLEKEDLMDKTLKKDTEIFNLKREISLSKVAYNTEKFQYKKLEEKNSELLENYNKVVKENNKLKQDYKIIEDGMKIKNKEHERNENLEAMLKEKDKKVKALETRIENLNLENSEQEKKFLSNEIKVDVLKSELELKNNKLYYITKQLEDLEDELEKKTEENQAKEEENQALKEKEKALELKIEEYEKESTEKEVRIEELESDLESKIEENQDLTTEIEGLKEELRKYKIAYIKQREKLNTLKNREIDLKENNNTLNSDELKGKLDTENKVIEKDKIQNNEVKVKVIEQEQIQKNFKIDRKEIEIKINEEVSKLKWNNRNTFIQNKDNLVEYLKTFSSEDFKKIYSEAQAKGILKKIQEKFLFNILQRIRLKLPVTNTDIEKILPLYNELMEQLIKEEEGKSKQNFSDINSQKFESEKIINKKSNEIEKIDDDIMSILF